MRKSGTWKAQLTIAINFISSKDNDEEQVINWKNDEIEVMTYDNVNGVIKEIFEVLLFRYQIELETSIRGSDCTLEGVNLLYYQCHKMNFKRGGSDIDSSD